MAIKLRVNKASALNYTEMDRNFSSFFYSASVDPNTNKLKLWYTGSAALNGSGESYDPDNRFTEVDLQPTTGVNPTLVVASPVRSIQLNGGNGQLGASSEFVYDINGVLGVGTGTPSVLTKVHVKGNTLVPAVLRLESVNSGTTVKKAGIEFYQGTSFKGSIGRIDHTSDNFYIRTAAGYYATPGNLFFQVGDNTLNPYSFNNAALTPTGFGIGTLNPQHTLHAEGNGYFAGRLGVGAAPGVENLRVYESSQLQSTIGEFKHFANFSNIPLSSLNALNISIVRTATGTDWQTSGMRLQQRVDSEYMGYLQFSGDGNNYGITMGTGTSGPNGSILIPTEKFRIDSVGRVGIGTKTATEILTVQGNISGSGNIRVGGTATVGLSLTTGTAITVGTNLIVGATASIGYVPASVETTPRILTVSQTAGSIGRVEYITGVVPKGAIMMWNGAIAPTGWTICDGNGGNQVNQITIPDLRERFIVGAGSSPDIITYNYDTFTMSSTGLPFRTGTGPAWNQNQPNAAGTSGAYPNGMPTYTGISVGGTFNRVNNTSAVTNGVFYNSINSGAGNPPGYNQYALYALVGPTPATSFFLVYHMEDRGYRLYRGSVPANNTNVSSFTAYPYYSPPQGSVATLSQVGEFVTYRPNFSNLIWTENTTGYAVGDKGGLVNVKLGVSELASHYHEVKAYAGVPPTLTPNNLNINSPVNGPASSYSERAGGDMPHENRPPYYALSFIIYTGA